MESRKNIQWVEIRVTTVPEGIEKVATILNQYGEGGAVIDKWEGSDGRENLSIKAYMLSSQYSKHYKVKIVQELAESGFPLQITEHRLKQEDWLESLKNDFKTMEIGEKIVIKPSWVPQSGLSADKIIIELDPGAAFGTGLHPTTRLCLINLEKYLSPGVRVLDLGTGTGILSIAAVKLGAAEVLALDTDAAAVNAARSNAEKNGVNKYIQVKRGTLSSKTQIENKEKYDIAVANITARAICELADRLYKVLKPGGKLIASGIHAEGLDQTLINLALSGFKLEATDQEKDWYAVIASRKE